MNRFLLSALAAGTFLSSGLAVAANTPSAPPPPPPHAHGLFEEMDANKDGVVTRAEVKAALDKRFAELDTDHNGVITEAERQAEHERVRTERLNARFDRLDTDKNGQISRDEFRAAHEMRFGGPEGPEGKGGPDGAGPPPPPPPGGPGAGPDDKGGPGGPRFGHRHFGMGMGMGGGFGGRPGGDVTKEQFSERPLRLFDTIDSNHDGKITAAERDAATALMHPRRPDGPPPADAPRRN